MDEHNNDDRITMGTIMLLNIFPEEIWIQILEEATDSVKENLSNAYSFFRNLLFHEPTLFLFPKVWNILCVKYHQRQLPISDTEPKRYGDSDPLPEILKFRLICHKWCETIDKFYENIPKILQDDKELLFSKRDQLLNQLIYGGSYRRIITVVGHFDKTHEASNRNPFLGRIFNIKLGTTGGYFWTDVLIPLRKYGKHIWYFNISINSYGLSWTLVYTMLRRVLEEIPNLKTLSIDRCNFSTSRNRLNNVRPGDVYLLNDEINLNPLPKINSLQSIKTQRLLPPIFKEIINRNSHITSLDVYQKQKMYNEGNDLLNILLPNLKTFSMSFAYERMFENFENAQLFPNLEELQLYLEFVHGLDWRRVFRALEEKCGNTVKKLEIRLPGKQEDYKAKEIHEESATLRLNLPWVKNLTLELPKMACLDFILPMKDSLEILDVTLASFEVDKCDLLIKHKQQTVHFVGWTDDLYASNIWILFPKLKEIIHRECLEPHAKSWKRKEWEKKLNALSSIGIA